MRLLSPIASIARGSVAGLTFTANQYHQIVVRARTSPVNPKTTFQEMMRVAFAASSNAWKQLTQTQRNGWNDYATTVKFPGPLGEYSIPGRNMFMSSLALVGYINNRGLASISQELDPPVVSGVPSWSNIEFVVLPSSGTGYGIKVQNDSGEDMNYFMTRSIGFDTSRERFKGPFVSASSVSAEIADTASDTVSFDSLTAGLRYFTRIKGITVNAPHRQSFEVIINGLATTVI